jgi:hypothetical protein
MLSKYLSRLAVLGLFAAGPALADIPPPVAAPTGQFYWKCTQVAFDANGNPDQATTAFLNNLPNFVATEAPQITDLGDGTGLYCVMLSNGN